MLSPKPTFFILISSLSAFLSSATAARAPAGQKMIFGAQTVVSNGTYLCLSGRSDLSVTVINCRTQLDYVAWAVTAGSAASTAPPLGTITHQYVPTANSPRNGTFCLAVNVTTSNIATVPDGTNVVLKPCVSTDVAQQWAVREGDDSHNELCFTAHWAAWLEASSPFQTASAPPNVPNRTSRTLLSQQEALPLGKIIWGSDRVTGPSPNSGRCISGAIVPKTKLQIVDCIPGNVNQTWTIVQEISKTPSF
ncbi:hypothetical protein C8J57DRAFT_1259898 [Mycena rebaudengoi]|nr:hypothetical protein C8J57DRAFT_1259898 [Mycena rebaudengoi]